MQILSGMRGISPHVRKSAVRAGRGGDPLSGLITNSSDFTHQNSMLVLKRTTQL